MIVFLMPSKKCCVVPSFPFYSRVLSLLARMEERQRREVRSDDGGARHTQLRIRAAYLPSWDTGRVGEQREAGEAP